MVDTPIPPAQDGPEVQTLPSVKPTRLTLLLTYVLGAAVLGLSFTTLRTGLTQPHLDFDVHYFGAVVERQGTYTDTAAIEHLEAANGRYVLTTGIYGTPALVALIFIPLSHLPYHLAAHSWDIFLAVILVVSIRKAAKTDWPLWLCAGLLTYPMLQVLSLGNPSVVTFSLLAYAYGALRDNNSRAAGFCLGMATILKLYPGFLVVVLIVHRQWRALGWAAGTAGVAAALTVVVLGPHNAWIATRSMMELTGGTHPELTNESIPGHISRIFHNNAIAGASTLVLTALGAIAVYMFRSRDAHRTWAIACCVMLLAQSITWVHYLTLTLLVLLAMRGIAERDAWALAFVGFVLVAKPIHAPLHHRYDWQEAVPKTAGISLMLVALIVCVLRERYRSPIAEPNG